MYGKCNHSPDPPSPPRHRVGFLQKNNSLEERSRIVSSLQERTAKSLLTCDNGGGDARFRRTETDFSNLFARGEREERGCRWRGTRHVYVKDVQFKLHCDAFNIKYEIKQHRKTHPRWIFS